MGEQSPILLFNGVPLHSNPVLISLFFLKYFTIIFTFYFCNPKFAIMTNLYLDLEWFTNQKLFLIGYAYSIKDFGQLYENTLTVDHLEQVFMPADGYVFFYGPDIAMLEKFFNINIRDHCPCVNLIRVFKKALPGRRSYKLSELEKTYGINRSTVEYKTNIFKLWHDWNDLHLRKLILKYNMEDVLNLIRLKKYIFNDCSVTKNDLNELLLS
jgi:hypothetical protein